MSLWEALASSGLGDGTEREEILLVRVRCNEKTSSIKKWEEAGWWGCRNTFPFFAWGDLQIITPPPELSCLDAWDLKDKNYWNV